jgi:hypothetical protein
MKKAFTKVLLLIVVIICTTCDYPFSEDYFKEIEVTEPVVSLSLTNFFNGEILTKPKNINYNYLASDKNRLYEIRFYINDYLIKTSEESSGIFFLDVENLENSEYNLKIEYFFKSGTESLAEITGAEVYQIIEEFNFSVDKNAKPINIIEIEHKEGTIFIHFEQYPLIEDIDESITAYLLVEENNSQSYRYISLTKEDLLKGYYNDIKATKLNLKYKTRISNYYNEVDSPTKEIKITDTFEFKSEFIENKNIKLSWSEHPLYSNIPYLRYSYFTHSGFQVMVAQSTKEGEFILENPGIHFGTSYQYFLTLHNEYNKDISIYSNLGLTEGIIHLGEYFQDDAISTLNNNWPKYTNFVYDKITDKFYSLEVAQDNRYPIDDKVFIHQFNSKNLRLEKTTFITNTIGYRGDFSINSNGNLIIDLNEKSLILNTTSLSINKEISGKDYSVLDVYSIVRYRENIVLIDTYSNSANDDIYFYNTSSKKLIYEINNSDWTFNVSKNGEYFKWRNKIYNLENDTYNVFYDNSVIISDIIFNENEFYLTSQNGDFISLDIITQNPKVIKNIQNINTLSYDTFNNRILIRNSNNNFSPNEIILYDFNTSIFKDMKVYDNDKIFLLNNMLVSTRGFYLKN